MSFLIFFEISTKSIMKEIAKNNYVLFQNISNVDKMESTYEKLLLSTKVEFYHKEKHLEDWIMCWTS